jgi:hypothetical protein
MMAQLRRFAWLAIAVVDAGFVAWGAMAALAPDHLAGPGSKAILPAGYEGYTGAAWPSLALAAPKAAGYLALLFRTYGAYNVGFGVMGVAVAAFALRRGEAWAWWSLLAGNTITLGSAMAYDRTVRAIGPFELSEYLGLAVVYAALAITAPLLKRASKAIG